jgi:hypothetical protein
MATCVRGSPPHETGRRARSVSHHPKGVIALSQIFSLAAQKAGLERHVQAELDGSGITVYRDGTPVVARTGNDAIRIARDYIGEFLQPAQRGGIPWGLRVSVADGQAAYGEWPLSGGGPPSQSFRNTALFRIHDRWHDSGPLSALENAIQILREYVPRGSRGRLAA